MEMESEDATGQHPDEDSKDAGAEDGATDQVPQRERYEEDAHHSHPLDDHHGYRLSPIGHYCLPWRGQGAYTISTVLPPSPDEASARVRFLLGIDLAPTQVAAVCGRLAQPTDTALAIRGRDVVTGELVTRTTTSLELLAAELP